MFKQIPPFVIVASSLLLFSLTYGLVVTAEQAESEAQSFYWLRTAEMGSAGTYGTSTNYKTGGTLGQSTPIGMGSASYKSLLAGFWGRYKIPTPVPPVVIRNELHQNFPNPFNPVTTIKYFVSTEGHVAMTIYNVKGQRIRRLINESKLPGSYSVTWDGRNERGVKVSSGIYFYRLETGTYSSTKKMLLLR